MNHVSKFDTASHQSMHYFLATGFMFLIFAIARVPAVKMLFGSLWDVFFFGSVWRKSHYVLLDLALPGKIFWMDFIFEVTELFPYKFQFWVWIFYELCLVKDCFIRIRLGWMDRFVVAWKIFKLAGMLKQGITCNLILHSIHPLLFFDNQTKLYKIL